MYRAAFCSALVLIGIWLVPAIGQETTKKVKKAPAESSKRAPMSKKVAAESSQKVAAESKKSIAEETSKTAGSAKVAKVLPDAIEEAQTRREVAATRPEQRKTEHDESELFLPARAPFSSSAFKEQPD